MLRQRDLLAVEERLELDRGARVAELLDEGEKLVELLRVAHGEAEQRVELTHHVVVADDGALRGAEIAEFVEEHWNEGDGFVLDRPIGYYQVTHEGIMHFIDLIKTKDTSLSSATSSEVTDDAE